MWVIVRLCVLPDFTFFLNICFLKTLSINDFTYLSLSNSFYKTVILTVPFLSSVTAGMLVVFFCLFHILAQMVLGAAPLEHLRVKFVVKGHLHGVFRAEKTWSLPSFKQLFPYWFSAGNLMVGRSCTRPQAAASLLLFSDLDHVWSQRCVAFKLKHRGSAATEEIQPKVGSVRLNRRLSLKMNIFQGCCLPSKCECFWERLLQCFDLAGIEKWGTDWRQT